MKRKLLALVLAVILCLSLLPAAVFAEGGSISEEEDVQALLASGYAAEAGDFYGVWTCRNENGAAIFVCGADGAEAAVTSGHSVAEYKLEAKSGYYIGADAEGLSTFVVAFDGDGILNCSGALRGTLTKVVEPANSPVGAWQAELELSGEMKNYVFVSTGLNACLYSYYDMFGSSRLNCGYAQLHFVSDGKGGFVNATGLTAVPGEDGALTVEIGDGSSETFTKIRTDKTAADYAGLWSDGMGRFDFEADENGATASYLKHSYDAVFADGVFVGNTMIYIPNAGYYMNFGSVLVMREDGSVYDPVNEREMSRYEAPSEEDFYGIWWQEDASSMLVANENGVYYAPFGLVKYPCSFDGKQYTASLPAGTGNATVTFAFVGDELYFYNGTGMGAMTRFVPAAREDFMGAWTAHAVREYADQYATYTYDAIFECSDDEANASITANLLIDQPHNYSNQTVSYENVLVYDEDGYYVAKEATVTPSIIAFDEDGKPCYLGAFTGELTKLDDADLAAAVGVWHAQVSFEDETADYYFVCSGLRGTLIVSSPYGSETMSFLGDGTTYTYSEQELVLQLVRDGDVMKIMLPDEIPLEFTRLPAKAPVDYFGLYTGDYEDVEIRFNGAADSAKASLLIPGGNGGSQLIEADCRFKGGVYYADFEIESGHEMTLIFLKNADGSVSELMLGAKLDRVLLHHLVKVNPKAATCGEAGISTAYWVCTDDGCNKYFADGEGMVEISKATVDSYTVPATGHHVDNNKDGKCDVCSATVSQPSTGFFETIMNLINSFFEMIRNFFASIFG